MSFGVIKRMDVLLPKRSEPEKKTGYHHGNLRAAIFDAVAQLIDERRSLNFHLKDVAALVGTSQPAIYKHFDGKDALLVEMAVKGYELQTKYRDHAMEQTDGSPLARLLALGIAYVEFARIHPGFFLLMKNLETREILSSKRYLTELNKAVAVVLALIGQCIENGSFEDVDPHFALVVLQSTAYGLAQLYMTGQINRIVDDNASDPKLTERAFAKSMSALLSEKGKKDLKNIL